MPDPLNGIVQERAAKLLGVTVTGKLYGLGSKGRYGSCVGDRQSCVIPLLHTMHCSAVKTTGCKNRHDDDNFTHMQARPLKGRNTKVCVWGEVPDVITPIKFDVDRFRGF